MKDSRVQSSRFQRRGQKGGFIRPYLLAALVMAYLSYSLPRLLPGDFVTAMYSSSHVTLSAEQEAQIRAYYTHRDGFSRLLGNLLSLNWGYSNAFMRPVSELILGALPWTLLLVGSAHLISMVLGFVGGVEAAWRRGGGLEKAGVGCMTVLEGAPEIGTGVGLLLLFALSPGVVSGRRGRDRPMLNTRRRLGFWMWPITWSCPWPPSFWPISPGISFSPAGAWSWC